jgi:hypothetical protein
LLLALFARLLFGALALSRTADEASHIASGYTALARGPDGLWTMPLRGHPLLIDAWLAVPVYAGQPGVRLEELPGWQGDYTRYVDSFVHHLDASRSVLFSARVQGMLLTVLLAIAVWRWATDLWGWSAGLLGLGVLVFDPTLVAHGRLATNDVGLVTVGTWTLYNAWRWMRRPSWGRALGTGCLLTLTMVSKGSGVLWGSIVGLLILSSVRRPREGRPRPTLWRANLVAQWFAAGALSLFLLWAAHGFGWGPVTGLPFDWPAPLYWEGLLCRPVAFGDRWVYALGQRTTGRWWWYFALAFVIKNPLPFLLITGVGLWEILVRRRRFQLGVLALFPLIYVLMAVVTGLNIGYRHMLPVHPFFYLAIAGGLVQRAEDGRSGKLATVGWARWLAFGGLAALGVWYAVLSIRIYPYEIAYFSVLVGGPDQGFRYLADSNLDWGQTTHVREAYVRANPDVRDDPPSSPFNPEPGQYIVSASGLQGIGTADPYAYEWFRHREPEAVIDYSLLVYEVPSIDVAWVAQCNQPRKPLSEVALMDGIGRPVRSLEFDCKRTWVYPGGLSRTGLYVLHHALADARGPTRPTRATCVPELNDLFVVRHLAYGRVSYEQEYGNQGVPFVLYEMPAGGATAHGVACVAQAVVVPAMLEWSSCGSAPVSMQGPLVFLNATVHRDKERVEVDTWWQVSGDPITRPFAVMGHLLSNDGQVLGQADGLGISPLALLSGDVLVQRHAFDTPSQEDVWLRTGVYWADTMERWAVSGLSEGDVLLVNLQD